MADDLELLPDAGDVFRAWAIADPSLVDDIAGRVSIRLQGAEPQIRYSVVSAAGGGQYGEGMPLLLVECWGRANAPDDGTASRVARTVAATAHRLAGASVDTGPYSSPDPASSRPRYSLTLRLLTFG